MTEDELKYGKYLAKIGPMDMLIREQEAKELLEKGKVEDSFAYALAAGIKMGIQAVLDEQGNNH